MRLTPFSVTYLGVASAPSGADFEEASQVTADYLSQVFQDTFQLNPFTTLISATVTPTGNSGTDSIDYDVQLTFKENSESIPSQSSLDVLVQNAFKPPQIQFLIDALTATAGTFSSTTDVTYTAISAAPQSAKRGGFAGKSQFGADHDAGGEDGASFNPLPYVGAFSAVLLSMAFGYWVYSRGGIRKVLGMTKKKEGDYDGEMAGGKNVVYDSGTGARSVRSGTKGADNASAGGGSGALRIIHEEFVSKRGSHLDEVNISANATATMHSDTTAGDEDEEDGVVDDDMESVGSWRSVSSRSVFTNTDGSSGSGHRR